MRLALLFALSPLLFAAVQAEPTSLFDGKTLDGWDFNSAMWRVEDGVITGGSTTEKIKKNDFISTKKSYQNFELKFKSRSAVIRRRACSIAASRSAACGPMAAR